jgi:phospholipid/cholesterol/gamma-HCH transport system permease protein
MIGSATRLFRGLGSLSFFLWDTLRETAEDGVRWEAVWERGWSTGVRSLPVLVLMSAFVGSIVALQGFHAFSVLGAQSMVGLFVHLAGVREVAPLLAGVMVAAKAGTELAAQLAVMRGGGQIDALEMMGVGPRSELVTPSILGIILVMPALTLASIGVCLLSATFVAVGSLGLDQSVFLSRLWEAMTVKDLAVAAVKGLTFGLIIVCVSTFQGFHADIGPNGVGKATNRTVVTLCVVCVCVNYLLTELFYG